MTARSDSLWSESVICDCTSETGCVGRGIYNCYDAVMRTAGEYGVMLAEANIKRITELEAALRETIEGWEDGANYKGDYLKEKHCDAEGIAKVRAVLQNKAA